MTLVNEQTGEIVEFDAPAAERRAERITLRLDAIADNYRAVLPMIREAIEKRDDIALGYRSPGDYVSDRFGQALAGLGLEVRRAVVGELTAAGMSTRAIGAVVSTSVGTVHNDQVFNAEHLTADDDEAAQHAEDVAAPVTVTGIDGKTYVRPAPVALPERADQAVTEFPDLAYYRDLGELEDVVNMAGDLRRFRERGELDVRLDNLRRSIAVDRADRDGSYRPGMTAVMDEDGEYRMKPMTALPTPVPDTCPTCGQTVRN